jgi:hypothetical protein
VSDCEITMNTRTTRSILLLGNPLERSAPSSFHSQIGCLTRAYTRTKNKLND